MIERAEPPGDADERTMLTSFLDYYRAIAAAEGRRARRDEQARTAAVEPSDLSIMGLIRHMAEVERSWFRGGSPPRTHRRCTTGDHDEDGDLHPGPDDTLVDAIAAFDDERLERTRSITDGARPRSTTVGVHTRRSPDRAGFRPNLRWILVHMIEEYARHCGHADLLRERVDGTTGD